MNQKEWTILAQFKEIQTVEEWQEALEKSASQPLLVFKHSTTCPISANALKEYETYLNKEPRQDVDYYFVKVIESRDVSNKIADDLGVKHESPQAIVVEGKKEVWNKSHWDITQTGIRQALS